MNSAWIALWTDFPSQRFVPLLLASSLFMIFTISLQISWLKDGQPFDHSSTFLSSNHGQSLQLAKAAHQHEGRYACIAENAVGTVQRSFMVKIADAPQLEGESSEEIVLLTGVQLIVFNSYS
jgi:hypothetical protein